MRQGLLRSASYRKNYVKGAKRGADLMQWEVDWGVELGIDFDKIKRDTEAFVVERVTSLAEDGKRPTGSKFRRYSKEYQRQLRKAGDKTSVDLTRSGAMLSSFKLVKARTRRLKRKGGEEAQLVMTFRPSNEQIKKAIALHGLGFRWIGLGKQSLEELSKRWERLGLIFKKRGKSRQRKR